MFVPKETLQAVQSGSGMPELSIEDLNAVVRSSQGTPDPRAIEPVEIEVGVHKACGGAIWYQSMFADVASMSELVDARHRPRYEEVVCNAWCKGCGSAIVDPDMLRQFAERVAAYRNRQD